jgi:hypothetical protein
MTTLFIHLSVTQSTNKTMQSTKLQSYSSVSRQKAAADMQETEALLTSFWMYVSLHVCHACSASFILLTSIRSSV